MNARHGEAWAREEGTATFVPYSNHVTRSAIRLVNGDYIQVIRLQGAAHESADVRDINSWHDQITGFIRNIASPHVALWSHIVRREYDEYPGGAFAPGFCRDFNARYKASVASGRMLVNELYISLVYRPQPVKAAKLLDRLAPRSAEQAREQQLDDIEALEELSSAALSSLDRFEPELLGCYERNGHMFSEVLEFLAYLVDGEWRRFPLPRSQIRNLLCTARPFFGKGGLLALKGPARTQYGAMLTIQEYPAMTCPGILNDLLSLPCEILVSQSFTLISKHAGLARMKQQQSRLIKAGDVAESQIDGISEALDALSSNHFVMGTHSLSILLRDEDAKALNGHVSNAGTVLSEAGMKWVREDIGMAGAFWAQLPGNFEYRVRAGDIHSRNFAGFSCFHNFPTGRIQGNQWGDAVTMFRTTSDAPYFFNFHRVEKTAELRRIARLDPNHRDLANTVVIGKSGSGKTVLEMVLLAMSQKFDRPDLGKPQTCVLFDKDMGASVGIRAMGGRYYPVKNGVPTGWNPFQLEPTPNNLLFLERLVKRLVKHEALPITPRQDREISDAIRGVMSATRHKRRLSSVLEFFDPTDETGIYPRLRQWCSNGPLGWLFDNPEDSLRLDDCSIVGFDVSDFLENDVTRTPTIMYLFHRIEGLFDGRRVQIHMDEVWRLLDDEAFEDFTEKKLVTIRKQDGFLVMYTQAPKQVLRSDIAYAIIEQTANKIFLPNPEADRDDYVNGFKLTEREFEIIRSLGEKSRRFLVKHGENSVVCELNLRGFEDDLAVLSGNTVTANLAEKLVAELGDDPAAWLPEFHRRRKEAGDLAESLASVVSPSNPSHRSSA